MRYIRIVALSELVLDPMQPPSNKTIERLIRYYLYREFLVETNVYVVTNEELALYCKMKQRLDLFYRVIGSVIIFERNVLNQIRIKGDLIYLIADRQPLSI